MWFFEIGQTIALLIAAIGVTGGIGFTIRDHNQRIKSLEGKMPDKLAERLISLEKDLPKKLDGNEHTAICVAASKNVEAQLREFSRSVHSQLKQINDRWRREMTFFSSSRSSPVP